MKASPGDQFSWVFPPNDAVFARLYATYEGRKGHRGYLSYVHVENPDG